MSILSQIPQGAWIRAVGATLARILTQTSPLAFVVKWLGLQVASGRWRLLAIFLLLTNVKNLPFVWHFRFFGAFFYQLYFQPTSIPPHALFQPVISSTRTTLVETDYNLHKSNSTYFSDMDISRTHLFAAILRRGIRKDYTPFDQYRKKKTGDIASTPIIIALGGINCFFKREIPPYQKFEMWTRLVCWDHKWFYMVTHLVKPGVAKPQKYTLQPWRKPKGSSVNVEEDEEKTREKLKNAVFASAISRYVVKKGRLTVAPEPVLLQAEMVPKKPEGWVYKGDGEVSEGVVDDVMPATISEDEWNWDKIEAERRRGLKFVESFTQLEGLHDLFDGGKNGVLGEYMDVMF